MKLTGTVENIGGILCLTGFVDGGFRLPEDSPELDTTVGKALTQHL